MAQPRGRVIWLHKVPKPVHPVEAAFRANEQRLIRYLAFRLGSIEEARDVAQALFLKMWSQKTLAAPEAIVPILFVAARNAATDVLRARRARARHVRDESGAIDVEDEKPRADREIAARHTLNLVVSLLDELPAKCRTAFVAYKFHGRSYAEIASEMLLTESMVRKYVLRAVSHCAARFEQMEGWE